MACILLCNCRCILTADHAYHSANDAKITPATIHKYVINRHQEPAFMNDDTPLHKYNQISLISSFLKLQSKIHVLKTKYCFIFHSNIGYSQENYGFSFRKKMKTSVLLSSFISLVVADFYSSRYDDFDVQPLIENDRILMGYMKCFLEMGPCTPDAKDFKSKLCSLDVSSLLEVAAPIPTIRRVLKAYLNYIIRHLFYVSANWCSLNQRNE